VTRLFSEWQCEGLWLKKHISFRRSVNPVMQRVPCIKLAFGQSQWSSSVSCKRVQEHSTRAHTGLWPGTVDLLGKGSKGCMVHGPNGRPGARGNRMAKKFLLPDGRPVPPETQLWTPELVSMTECFRTLLMMMPFICSFRISVCPSSDGSLGDPLAGDWLSTLTLSIVKQGARCRGHRAPYQHQLHVSLRGAGSNPFVDGQLWHW